MGLLDPTTHLHKTTRTSLFGTRIYVAYCGKEWKDGEAERGPDQPGWIASCSTCARRAGQKW